MSFVKALLGARETLLEEMQRLSKAIGQPIDLAEFISNMNNVPLSNSTVDSSRQGKEQNNLEVLAFNLMLTSFYRLTLFRFLLLISPFFWYRS